MKTITMTAWKRPDLTKQVLESLTKCYKIENYKLLAFIEPGYDQVIDVFDKFNACEKQIVINNHVLGIAENTKQALSTAFNQSDYNIHIEDDTVLLPNALNFFEWCDDNFRDDHQIGTCSAYSGNTSESLPTHAIIHRWFGCWAWSTWKTRWDYSLKNEWGGDMLGFAANVNGWQFKNKKLQVYPMQSLCHNIGIGNILSTNGRNFKPDNIRINNIIEENNDFQVIDRQIVSDVSFSDNSASPSEAVICVDFCNRIPNTATKLYGCKDGIIEEHLLITDDANATQAVFNYDAFPNDIHNTIIIIGAQKEKTEFLEKSGYKKRDRVYFKCGVERWIKMVAL